MNEIESASVTRSSFDSTSSTISDQGKRPSSSVAVSSGSEEEKSDEKPVIVRKKMRIHPKKSYYFLEHQENFIRFNQGINEDVFDRVRVHEIIHAEVNLDRSNVIIQHFISGLVEGEPQDLFFQQNASNNPLISYQCEDQKVYLIHLVRPNKMYLLMGEEYLSMIGKKFDSKLIEELTESKLKDERYKYVDTSNGPLKASCHYVVGTTSTTSYDLNHQGFRPFMNEYPPMPGMVEGFIQEQFGPMYALAELNNIPSMRVNDFKQLQPFTDKSRMRRQNFKFKLHIIKNIGVNECSCPE